VFGFKYWKDPGAFSNGALGVVNAFVLASFSMQGTEIVGITAGECENPLKVKIIIYSDIIWLNKDIIYSKYLVPLETYSGVSLSFILDQVRLKNQNNSSFS
jgi:hypothetical protein